MSLEEISLLMCIFKKNIYLIQSDLYFSKIVVVLCWESLEFFNISFLLNYNSPLALELCLYLALFQKRFKAAINRIIFMTPT